MYLKYLVPLGVMLVVGLIGCSTHRTGVTLPEPCPLGKEFTTYKPPRQPSAAVSTSLQLKEPTGVITLRQALSLALMNNPGLAAFSWEIRAKEARTLQASLVPNPELEIEVEEFGGADELSGFDAAATTLQLSQLIELGGKRSKRIQVAALERDLAGWDYETKRIDILTEVTKAFVDVLAAQERLSLNKELVRLAERVLNTVSERVKAGKVSPVEETKARVTLSTSRIELERAKRWLEATRKQLAASWGSTSPTFEKVDAELKVIIPIPSAEQLVYRISNNPDIARWIVEIEKRQASVELEDAMRIPDLTFRGGIRRFNETDNNAFVLGLSIPLPIFNRNQGGVLEARYSLAKADAERRAVSIQVQAALSNAYRELSTSFAEATALKNEVLPGAQSAFDAAAEGYRQGKFGYLDVLDAQRTLFEVRVQYIHTLSAYHKAFADVERLIGERLDAIKKTP